MSTLFTAEFFAGNRKRLRELAKTYGPVVATAAGLMQRSADSPLPFQQDSNFWYLTGIGEPDVVLVIDKNEEYLILPSRSDYQDVFSGLIGYSGLSVISGVKKILPEREGWQKLSAELKKSKQAATIFTPPPYVKSHGMYTNPARARLIRKLNRYEPDLKLTDLRSQLALMRTIKQPAEIAAIQTAVYLSIQAFQAVRSRSYGYEYELEADFTQIFKKAGAQHAYDPIVGSGRNACVLHYMKNAGPIRAGDLTLIDAGAEYSHYAADITRVFSFGKEPTPRQKAVHQAVLETQDFALRLLKPGALLKDNEKQIENFIGEQLKKLGLIKSINTKSVRQYYPHAVSHFLGLDVHDAGDYSRPLESGMVLTCEPGIYIPEEGIGVRIEDDIFISKDGCEILSASLPRDL